MHYDWGLRQDFHVGRYSGHRSEGDTVLVRLRGRWPSRHHFRGGAMLEGPRKCSFEETVGVNRLDAWRQQRRRKLADGPRVQSKALIWWRLRYDQVSDVSHLWRAQGTRDVTEGGRQERRLRRRRGLAPRRLPLALRLAVRADGGWRGRVVVFVLSDIRQKPSSSDLAEDFPRLATRRCAVLAMTIATGPVEVRFVPGLRETIVHPAPPRLNTLMAKSRRGLGVDDGGVCPALGSYASLMSA